MGSNALRKQRRAIQRRKDKGNRGVAAAVIMAVDTDGRRGVLSPQGDSQFWSFSFDDAWSKYIAKEKKMAAEQGTAPEQVVIQTNEAEPISD